MPTHQGDSAPWPHVSYQPLPWAGDLENVPRRHQSKFSGPYEAALVAPIETARAHLGSEIRAAADEATAEIARFDADMSAGISPLPGILLRSESASSSQIEHLTASARAIASAELGDTSRHNASEIVANSRLMEAAIALADRLDGASIIEMHRHLLQESRPDIVGHWRTLQVWIGGSIHGPHTAEFVPPHHDQVPTAMDDLVAYLARDDVAVLEQAAIAHAQFETIHPFPDGNGRTGRAIVHSMLKAKGLTRNVTVPVSAGLLVDIDRYFAALTSYRAGDPAAIVECFADAAFAAVRHGRRLATELDEIRDRWQKSITVRSDAAAHRAIDVVTAQPVINVAYLCESLGISDRRAGDAIGVLVETGVLVQIGSSARNRRWQAPDVLRALDNFADRIARR